MQNFQKFLRINEIFHHLRLTGHNFTKNCLIDAGSSMQKCKSRREMGERQTKLRVFVSLENGRFSVSKFGSDGKNNGLSNRHESPGYYSLYLDTFFIYFISHFWGVALCLILLATIIETASCGFLRTIFLESTRYANASVYTSSDVQISISNNTFFFSLLCVDKIFDECDNHRFFRACSFFPHTPL